MRARKLILLLTLPLLVWLLTIGPAGIAAAQGGHTDEQHDNSGHVTITSLIERGSNGRGGTDLSKYQCTPGKSADCNHDCKVFDVPIPGCGPYAPIDPAQSARELVLGLQLQPPPLCLAPAKADSGAVGLVGMHAWAWICPDQIRDNTVGPFHRTIAAPGMIINATAHNTSVLVNWGDGSIPTVCAGALLPFTPYLDAADATPLAPTTGTPSPTCGHKIDKSSVPEPDQLFHGTATSNWLVYWQATNGPLNVGGVIPMPLTTNFAYRIGEVQVLNNGAGPR